MLGFIESANPIETTIPNKRSIVRIFPETARPRHPAGLGAPKRVERRARRSY